MLNQAHTWAEPDLYILADEDLIESSEKAVRRLCPIAKQADPVLVPDKAWEGLAPDGTVASLQDPLYGTVLYDPQECIFKAWYNTYDRYQNRVYSPPTASQGYSLCYAISRDGINWEKPELGEVLYDGSLKNNMLRVKDEKTTGTSNLGEQIWNVLPYSSPDSEDRYVASLHTSFNDTLFPSGITMCYSPDGIHWRMYYPPVLGCEGDCHGMSFDPTTGLFLLATRSNQHGNLCRRWGRPWKRHIALFKTRDLVHWTPGRTILEADDEDPEDTQLYLMYIIPYGHAYLGQLLMFYGHEMVLENQLAISHDLENWKRIGERKPILARGEEGSWDCKHVALTHNQPHPEGENMRFWFGGKNTPHYQAGYGALGTGILRRDGWACYEAGKEEGVITTIPFRPPNGGAATWLILNVDATDGEVVCEVIDMDGNPIEGVTRADCVPITGNHTRIVVNFKSGPGLYFHRGNFNRFWQDVRFRFYLRNAKLYAFKAQRYEPQWPKSE